MYIVPGPKESASSDVGDYRSISITPVPSKAFAKIVAENLSLFLEGSSLLSQLSYPRGLATRAALLTGSHHLQVALDGGMEERFVQLNFSAAFDIVSHIT